MDKLIITIPDLERKFETRGRTTSCTVSTECTLCPEGRVLNYNYCPNCGKNLKEK